MDIRHLRYFVAVAEEGNVTRAARRLGIQQPPLSQQIQALERELDTQLLQRRPRGVEMTEAGRVLLAEARDILDQLERTVARVKRSGRGEEGTLVIGFTSSAAFHPFVVEVLRSFGAEHPRVALTFEETATGELVQAIDGEVMDVAFIRSPVAQAQGLAVHRLMEEPMLVALPADHPFARNMKEPLPLKELGRERMVLYRRRSGPGLYDTIIAGCRDAGFTPEIEQEAPRITSTLNLVAAGLGVTIVPASLRKLHLEGVVYRPLAGPGQLTAPLSLTCPTAGQSVAAGRFVDHVRRAANRWWDTGRTA